MPALHLEPLDAKNIVAANSLTLKPGQEAFTTPASYVEAEHGLNQAAAWSRVVLDGDEVVGFIRGQLDADEPLEEFRCCVWSVNVKASAQGRGVGRFAVEGLAAEAKDRGFTRLTVIWERGDENSPDQFFQHIGFAVVDETKFGEAVGARDL
jgi:GNAT superfamily N-acetyltransferase